MILAREAKFRNPSLQVVLGGPQVPDNTQGFFELYPFVDVLVHGEGEKALLEVLQKELYPGVETRYTNLPSQRLSNLDELPSPYLSGVIDRLTQSSKHSWWVASWETNRGCPYSCSFCDWGSATYTKLRQYPERRLYDEITWFSKKKIEYIDCCDANFGMLPRDFDLARALHISTTQYGYPVTFRQSWAKNSSEKVIDIAKELQSAGLLKAVGLAVQSLDTTTLKIVKRKNLPFVRFSDLTRQFNAAQLPTYTEIIRGLPGETLESFKAGISTLVADSYIDTIYIYNCGILPNAPMADPEYRRRYDIKAIRSPIFLAHSTRGATVPEYEDVVIETSSMLLADMKLAHFFSWAILVGESLGLLKILRISFGDDATHVQDFYDRFLEFCQGTHELFGDEFIKVQTYVENGFSGLGWDHYDAQLGEISWPIEEASWLRLVESSLLPQALRALCRYLALDESVIDLQLQILVRRSETTSVIDWAREVMWYGRRGRKYLKG